MNASVTTVREGLFSRLSGASALIVARRLTVSWRYFWIAVETEKPHTVDTDRKSGYHFFYARAIVVRNDVSWEDKTPRRSSSRHSCASSFKADLYAASFDSTPQMLCGLTPSS